MRLQILPPHGFAGRSFQDFMLLGMIATALPAVHAIPAVCAARSGSVTYAELPRVTAAHCVPRALGARPRAGHVARRPC